MTEDNEEAVDEIKPKPAGNKSKSSSVNPKKPLRKAQSDFTLTQTKSQMKPRNGVNPSIRSKLERQPSKK